MWVEVRCSNVHCGAVQTARGAPRTRGDGSPTHPKLLARCSTGALGVGAIIEIKCPSCNQIIVTTDRVLV